MRAAPRLTCAACDSDKNTQKQKQPLHIVTVLFCDFNDETVTLLGASFFGLGLRLLVALAWGVDGPPGATGVLSRGVPSQGVWGAEPQGGLGRSPR